LVEKAFVDALQRHLKSRYSAVTIRPSDNYTLGVPDLLVWVPTCKSGSTLPVAWAMAIEAKQLRPLMPDPFHRGRRTGQMLKHPFTGPQISMLRSLKAAGVEAFGLVRASEDIAFRIEPEAIPAKTGNFTHEELVKFSVVVRRTNGNWQLFGGEP